MNFAEVASWACAHPEGSLAIAAGFVAAAVLTVEFVKPHFLRPTVTGFDDSKVKASRGRSALLMSRLGLNKPDEP